MNPSASALLEQSLTRLAFASGAAAVLALAVYLVTRILGKQLPARWRFALWLVVFVRLALPVAPAAPWGVLGLPDSPAPTTQTLQQEIAVRQSAAPPVDWIKAPSPVADFHASSTPDPESHAEPTAASWLPSWAVGLGSLWCAGLLFLMGRRILLGIRLARQRRTWRPVADPSLLALFQACKRELALTRPVELRLVVEPRTPALVGVWRPRILLPESMATHFSREELRLILLHELVHVRRRDVLIDRIVTLLACLHWFNPAAWLALVRLQDERELACDAAVLDHLGEQISISYGRVLLKIVEDNQRPGLLPGAVGVFSRTVALTRRIQMIAHYRKAPARQAALGLALLVLLAAFGLTESRSALRGEDAKTKVTSGAEEAGASVKLTGVCRDENDKPLKDVHVALYQENYRKLSVERLKEVTTDGEGRFALLDLPAIQPKAGTAYALVVTTSGRASSIGRGYGHKASEELAFTLPPAATLKGRVTDSTGKPVAGAHVWTNGLLEQPLDGVKSAQTDADGRYAITDLPAWDVAKLKPVIAADGSGTMTTGCYLSVRHPNYGESRPIYRRVPDAVDVVLEPAAVIEGRVIDQVSGKPAAGIVVSIQGTNASKLSHFSQARTDGDGKYQLTSLPAGSYNIWANAPDLACAAIDTFVVAAGKSSTAPDLKLVEGGWLEGRVVDADTGKPLSKDGARGGRLNVGLYGPSRPKSGAGCQYSDVDDNGYFRIHVAPGVQFPYLMFSDVWQRTQRRETFEKGVEVKSGEVASVVFRVLPKLPAADPDPTPVRLKMPVPAEREAADAVRRLGGWYEVDADSHIVEVNLVYHQSPEGQRLDNAQTDTDEALRVVVDFPRLRKLLLSKGQATDDGLANVARLKDLEILIIWDAAKVSDAGMAHLGGLPKLTNVSIYGGKLGDDSLKVFGQMPALRDLSLQKNDFTDAGLKHLAKLKHLRSLWIGMNRTRVTDVGIRSLSGLTALEGLDFQDSNVSDRGVAALKDMHELRTLYLGGTKGAKENTISDASLEILSSMTKMERLGLTNTHITKEGAKRLIALPGLKQFILESQALSEKERDELKQLKRPGLMLILNSSVVQ